MYLIVVEVYYSSPIVYGDFLSFLRWIIQTCSGYNDRIQYFLAPNIRTNIHFIWAIQDHLWRGFCLCL